ncbi:SDR family NAD(P)-dependent oxidoreductase [Nocardia salmonicida]|uniref:SDR family NAD(P)-dependent oxidoreductase n=1 Tax=Nocardia salmonicida TaxID=53431 RepID=UPI0009EEF51C|nr:SDR family oxidoreductase [Nocardia salmonicida]
MSERVVVITGGSRGLGAGLVKSFLDSGDKVATCSRSATPFIDDLIADDSVSARFHYSSVDVSDRLSAQSFVRGVCDLWGGVDVLVNNAGIARDGVIGLASPDDVDTVVDLNVKGTIHMTKATVRRMLSVGRGGRIVNVSSIVGVTGYQGLAIYSASKAALDGMTRSLARELGPRGITVNSIAPGYLTTEMSHGLTATQLEQIRRRTPMGRLGSPDDIADATQFLASSAASFINGHVLVVDGGLTA